MLMRAKGMSEHTCAQRPAALLRENRSASPDPETHACGMLKNSVSIRPSCAVHGVHHRGRVPMRSRADAHATSRRWLVCDSRKGTCSERGASNWQQLAHRAPVHIQQRSHHYPRSTERVRLVEELFSSSYPTDSLRLESGGRENMPGTGTVYA